MTAPECMSNYDTTINEYYGKIRGGACSLGNANLMRYRDPPDGPDAPMAVDAENTKLEIRPAMNGNVYEIPGSHDGACWPARILLKMRGEWGV